MNSVPDRFAHHPELRDKVRDPQESYFRTFKPEEFDERIRKLGFQGQWRLSDEEREATRIKALADHRDAELWVFAYGSLMWDPGFEFIDVLKAHIDGYSRSFCLKDELGARGTFGAPGLMAALDSGGSCTGLAFKIAREHLEEESEILWRREMVTGVYVPIVLDAESAVGTIKCIAFIANHQASRICPDLPREEKIRYLATGTGVLGTSFEYLENLADHLDALGINDPYVFSLLEEVRAYS